MADALRILPELVAILTSVRDEAAELNSEVKLMRQSVNRIESEMGELRTSLSPWARTRARFSRSAKDSAAEDGTA